MGQLELNAGRYDLQEGQRLKAIALNEIQSGDRIKGEKDLARAQMMISRGQNEISVGQRDTMLGISEMRIGRTELNSGYGDNYYW